MATVNIGGDQNDRNYRYKRPKVKNKIEGRGNGIKTVIPNMADIARSLHVDPRYPTKYFGIELGAQSTFDKKREEAIVNGSHDVLKMEGLMDKFIDVFILCPKCRLPELKMEVKKSIKITCSACGHHSELNSVHKLVTYILKNPPDTKGRRSNVEGKDASSNNNIQNGTATAGSDESPPDSPKSGEHSPTQDQVEAEAPTKAPIVAQLPSKGQASAKAATVAQLPSKGQAPAKAKNDDDVTWESDISPEAVKLRKDKEIEEMKTGKKSVETIVATAQTGVQKETAEEAVRNLIITGKATVDTVAADLRLLQMSRGFDDTEKMVLLLKGMLDNPTSKNVKDQIQKHISLLRPFAKTVASQNVILDGLEGLIASQPKLLAGFPNILHVLYEADVLNEEVINGWYDSPPEASKLQKKEVAGDIRKKSKVFVTWLRSNDDDDDEEEENQSP